jgi:hydrogenase maturation protease
VNEVTNTPAPSPAPDLLVFGIGNIGRSDDGLGWAFIDRIQQEPGVTGQLEYRYQLNVEDAALVSKARRVVFVDSCREELERGFEWKTCAPAEDFEFTTHVLPPRAVLWYCRDLYGKAPPAHLLMIQGHCWDLQTGLSTAAERGLERALAFFNDLPAS